MKDVIGMCIIAVALIVPGLAAGAQGTTTDNPSGATAQGHSEDSNKTIEASTATHEHGGRIHYRKVETKNYTIEVPEQWEVGEETPFGQREIRPAHEPAKAKPTESNRESNNADEKSATASHTTEEPSMSSMTGPGLGKQSWQQLYQTSLFYITRYVPDASKKMKPTSYVLGKSKQGFETCSWTMNDPDGHPLSHFVILKHGNDNILALSVKLPSSAPRESKKQLEHIFQHMVDTAVVR